MERTPGFENRLTQPAEAGKHWRVGAGSLRDSSIRQTPAKQDLVIERP
jgi:hypothetical protein